MKTLEQIAEERNDEKIKAARKYAKQYEGLMYTIGSIAGVSGIQMAFERGVAFGLHQALEITVEREKAERAAEQHWISVKERLPEESTHCVIRIDDGEYQVAWREDGYWIMYNPCCIYNSQLNNVTHWMPLPKPPEDK